MSRSGAAASPAGVNGTGLDLANSCTRQGSMSPRLKAKSSVTSVRYFKQGACDHLATSFV